MYDDNKYTNCYDNNCNNMCDNKKIQVNMNVSKEKIIV